jgi:DNA-binding NtrC family response regulator
VVAQIRAPAGAGRSWGTGVVIVNQVRRWSAVAVEVRDFMIQVGPSNRLNVLLPEEREGWPLVVSRLLEPQGVQTLTARDGREALRLIQSDQVHVAVLDAEMPQMGGMQVVKLMNDLHNKPPAILLANHLTNHLLHEALGMHVFSVLSKPVDLNLLLDALARVLRRFYESRWPGGKSGTIGAG